MPAPPRAKLILQILDEKHILNLSAETDERQLEIYGLALSKLRDVIEKYLLIDIPHETIIDGLEVLNDLSLFLVPASIRDTGEMFKITEDILPLVESALSSVSQAVRIYERERKKTKKGKVQKENLPQEYDDHIIRFRRLIIETHEHLREG